MPYPTDLIISFLLSQLTNGNRVLRGLFGSNINNRGDIVRINYSWVTYRAYRRFLFHQFIWKGYEVEPVHEVEEFVVEDMPESIERG